MQNARKPQDFENPHVGGKSYMASGDCQSKVKHDNAADNAKVRQVNLHPLNGRPNKRP